MRRDLDQVNAELGAHRPHQLPDGSVEGRLLEGSDHPATGKEIEVSTARLAHRVLRELARQGREVFTPFDTLLDLLQLALRRSHLFFAIGLQQNMAGPHLLLAGELGLVGVVIRQDLFVGDLDLGAQPRNIHHQVGNRPPLRAPIFILVLLEVGSDFLWSDRHLFGELVAR